MHVQVHHAGQETLTLNVDDLGIRRDIHIGTYGLNEIVNYEEWRRPQPVVPHCRQ